MGLSVDNTSVNMEKHNSIQMRATQKNPSVYMMGCPCHILHNIARKAGDAFRDVRMYAKYMSYNHMYKINNYFLVNCLRLL